MPESEAPGCPDFSPDVQGFHGAHTFTHKGGPLIVQKTLDPTQTFGVAPCNSSPKSSLNYTGSKLYWIKGSANQRRITGQR